MLGQGHTDPSVEQVHKFRQGPRLAGPREGVKCAVVSVPHTGTHAIMWALGWRQGVEFAPPRGATIEAPAIVGHLMGEATRQYPRRLTAERWGPYLEGRTVYLPVRDPYQAAWSLQHVHGFSWAQIKDTFAQAVEFIGRYSPVRVDIRTLKPQNVKGNGQRDESKGAELLRDFPEYFEGIY